MTVDEIEYFRCFDEPTFFTDPQDADIRRMQDIIRQNLNGETVTMDIEVEKCILEAAEKSFAEIGWTFEEGCIMLLKWCVVNPDKIKPWMEKNQSGVLDQ